MFPNKASCRPAYHELSSITPKSWAEAGYYFIENDMWAAAEVAYSYCLKGNGSFIGRVDLSGFCDKKELLKHHSWAFQVMVYYLNCGSSPRNITSYSDNDDSNDWEDMIDLENPPLDSAFCFCFSTGMMSVLLLMIFKKLNQSFLKLHYR